MPLLPPQSYEFAPFRVDAMRRLLLRDGQVVPLTAKAFETLLALLERCGEVVGKDELMQRVWPNNHVEEGNLSVQIFTLRRALGETRDEHRYIATVPGRGYSFVAAVRETGLEETAPLAEERSLPLAAEEPGTVPAAAAPPQRVRRKWRIVLALAVFVLGLAFALYKFARRPQPQSLPPFKLTRLTASGKVGDAVISPDGKYVAYTMLEGGQQSLWLKQVATGSEVQIRPPQVDGYYGLSFSPDGNYLYCTIGEGSNLVEGGLYRVPLLGGAPVKISAGVDSPVSFSPDGQQLAFVRNESGSGESRLLSASAADGSSERVLTARKKPDFFRSPAWSPDGRTIVCAVFAGAAEARRWQLLAVPVAGGAEKQLTTQGWKRVGRLGWLADGGGLILPTAEQMQGSPQLWRISYPEGAARRLTNDLTGYHGLSLTADAQTLVSVQTESYASIWLSSPGAAQRAVRLQGGRYDGLRGLAWTPDGQLVYEAKNADDSRDLWLSAPDGSRKQRLTFNARTNTDPAVSPDGRFVAFTSDRTGASHIWRVNIDGGNPLQLTSGSLEIGPAYSPDGRWVFYHSMEAGQVRLGKVSSAGGQALLFGEQMALFPVSSPDGQWIAYKHSPGPSYSHWRLMVEPVEGGLPKRIFDLPPTANVLIPARWTPDGSALTYEVTRDGASNIWRQPLAGGAPQPVTDFQSELIYSFAWSREGRLACARGGEVGDVVLISGFR